MILNNSEFLAWEPNTVTQQGCLRKYWGILFWWSFFSMEEKERRYGSYYRLPIFEAQETGDFCHKFIAAPSRPVIIAIVFMT